MPEKKVENIFLPNSNGFATNRRQNCITINRHPVLLLYYLLLQITVVLTSGIAMCTTCIFSYNLHADKAFSIMKQLFCNERETKSTSIT